MKHGGRDFSPVPAVERFGFVLGVKATLLESTEVALLSPQTFHLTFLDVA